MFSAAALWSIWKLKNFLVSRMAPGRDVLCLEQQSLVDDQEVGSFVSKTELREVPEVSG